MENIDQKIVKKKYFSGNLTKKNKLFKSLKIKKAWGTRDSQEVSHPSTNRAQQCLTCQIGRDGVLSLRYDPKRTRRKFFD